MTPAVRSCLPEQPSLELANQPLCPAMLLGDHGEPRSKASHPRSPGSSSAGLRRHRPRTPCQPDLVLGGQRRVLADLIGVDPDRSRVSWSLRLALATGWMGEGPVPLPLSGLPGGEGGGAHRPLGPLVPVSDDCMSGGFMDLTLSLERAGRQQASVHLWCMPPAIPTFRLARIRGCQPSGKGPVAGREDSSGFQPATRGVGHWQ